MALKIIKHGTVRASTIEPFLFSEKASFVLENDWPDISPVSASNPAGGKESLAEAGEKVVDLAHVEKTAYQNGFAQGEKAGMEIGQQKAEMLMSRYSESIAELGKLRSAIYTRVEHEVVKLAVEVAKKIVHREIQVDKDIIQTLVRVALTHVAEKSAVTIHLSPQDYSYLLEHRAELAQTEGRDIALLADKSIDRGGCLIQTECGDIDARVEEKFREVEQAFFEGLK